MSNNFSKLCKCKKCNKTMKYKKESGGLYICSSYDNYGKGVCDRIVVKESFLQSLVNRRFQKEMTAQDIHALVDYITVENSLLMEIHFKSDDIPILLQGRFVQF